MKRRLVVGLMVLLCTAIACGLAAQTSGKEYSVPLASEARNGRMVFQTADGSFRWWFDIRLQLDGAFYFGSKNPMSNGTVFRRLTFATKARLWKDWDTEFDVDFAEALLDLRDMWVKYTVPGTHLSLQVGNFKEPFGLERLTSSALLTFLERASVSNAFPLGRRMGAAARYWTKYGQVTGAIMGHEGGTRIDKGTRDEGYSSNVRVTLAPVNQHGKNLHVGAAFAYKTPDALADLPENTIEIKARHETYVSDPKLLHTGDIRDVNYYLRSGTELLGVYGPLFFQSEAMWTTVERWYGKPRVDMKGGYAFLTWMVTGETREYYVDQGEPGPVEAPKHSWGALELAARASFLDLNDLGAGIHGGSSKQLMLGVNYYPNVNIKLQFNYSVVDLDQYATRKGNMIGDDDHWFIQFRVQAVF